MLKRLWERFQGLIIIIIVIFFFWLILQPAEKTYSTKKILVIENGEVVAEYNDNSTETFGVDY